MLRVSEGRIIWQRSVIHRFLRTGLDGTGLPARARPAVTMDIGAIGRSGPHRQRTRARQTSGETRISREAQDRLGLATLRMQGLAPTQGQTLHPVLSKGLRGAARHGRAARACGLFYSFSRLGSACGGANAEQGRVPHAKRAMTATREASVNLRRMAQGSAGTRETGTLCRPARMAEAQRSRMKPAMRVGSMALAVAMINACNAMMHCCPETYAPSDFQAEAPVSLLFHGCWLAGEG